MSQVIRTFVAVRLPPLPEVSKLVRQLAGMKWPVVAVSDRQFHITLKFLGDTPAERVDEIRDAINLAIADQPAFSIVLKSVGAFPRLDRPSVIWVGMELAEPLIELANRLEQALEPLGFPRESRPFSPHLTLARIKGRPPQAVFDLLRRHAATDFGTADVTHVDYIRSDLGRDEESRYTTLMSQQLSPPAGGNDG